MRLLQLGTGDQLILTKYLTHNIPPYAILSHTWGSEEEEVRLQDIQGDAREDATWRQTYGYRKILFCGRQAKRDGIQHFWVDTCCIDKRSSAELSESINSMFRWYQNAQKCYVYLADVPSGSENDDTTELAWDAAFKDSKWFKRGWTLQELLAPRSVEFFAARGQRLGDKVSLERLIHSRTGIAIVALRGYPLSQFDGNERMSWLSDRETTRQEDMAYCMLGIFNVTMYCVYGEGREHAEVRLQQTIRDWPGAKLEVKFTLQSWLSRALKDFSQITESMVQDARTREKRLFYRQLRSKCLVSIEAATKSSHQDFGRSDLLEIVLFGFDSLVTAGLQQGNGSDKELFPGLAALHHLVNSEQDDQDIELDELIRFIAIKSEEKPAELDQLLQGSLEFYLAASRNARTPAQDIWLAATPLFEVLAFRRLCSCDPAHVFSVYLGLETHHNKKKNDAFDFLFSTGDQWQEVRIQTSSIPARRPRQSLSSEFRVPLQCLCTDISKGSQVRKDYRLMYQLEKDTLWKLPSEETNLKVDKSMSPISLAQILHENNVVRSLTKKNKRILSILLAYAVYHLDGTPWLKSPWNSSNVYFIPTTSGIPLRPYILAQLNQDFGKGSAGPLGKDEVNEVDLHDGLDCPDDWLSDLLSPPLPRLIALATVLMEINFETSFNSLAEGYGIKLFDIENAQTVYRYHDVSFVFDACRARMATKIESTISACLDIATGLGDDDVGLNENEVNDLIYKRVIRPLEEELEAAFSTILVAELDALVLRLDLFNREMH